MTYGFEPEHEGPEPDENTPTGGALGSFETLPSDGVSDRWRYRPSGGGSIPDADGNPCKSWIVTRPILNTADIADHSFVVVADDPGKSPQARFSYGPSKDGSHLISATGSQDDKDRNDQAAWTNWNNPLYGVRLEPIPATDASVIGSGRSLDHFLGSDSRPGPVGYSLTPEIWPWGSANSHVANSNSAAAAVADSAIARNPAPLNHAELPPYPGSLSPGWYRAIPGWKP